jgi:hypothetical protein
MANFHRKVVSNIFLYAVASVRAAESPEHAIFSKYIHQGLDLGELPIIIDNLHRSEAYDLGAIPLHRGATEKAFDMKEGKEAWAIQGYTPRRFHRRAQKASDSFRNEVHQR